MKTEFEVIASHSAQAPFYKFRTPYFPKYFKGLSNELGLSSDSVLLDICCGSGEMAKGLQAEVAKIYAIDGSAEMLSYAPKFDNVVYSQCDVNTENYTSPEPVDHFVIGRAIHWTEADALQRMADNCLKDNGKIAICSTQWFADGSWGQAYHEAIKKYDLFDKHVRIDFSGTETLHNAGFKPVRRLQYKSFFQCGLASLGGYALASAYGKKFEHMMENREVLKNDIVKAVGPHLVNGMVRQKIINWAILFERV